jgi:hypothetical protein
MLRRCRRNHSQFSSFSALTTAYARGKSDPLASTPVAVRRIPIISQSGKGRRTQIFGFQMSSVKAKERATIDKAGRTCTIADKNPLKLVVRSLFNERDAVAVARKDILAIFWESVICRVVGAVVELLGSVSRFKCCGIADFDAEFTVDVLGNVKGTIFGLVFELFGNMVGDIVASGLRMANMVEAEASMLVIVRFDTAG